MATLDPRSAVPTASPEEQAAYLIQWRDLYTPDVQQDLYNLIRGECDECPACATPARKAVLDSARGAVIDLGALIDHHPGLLTRLYNVARAWVRRLDEPAA